MLKMYKGNLICIKRNVDKNHFVAEITLYYRVGWFKFKKEVFKKRLNDNITLEVMLDAVRMTVDEYDSIVKI